MPYTKFDWFKAIYREPEFTDGEVRALGWIAIVYIKDSPSFCVRQSVIAKSCGVSEKTVGRAVRRAKRLGYMRVSRERDRGPGRDKADELTLTFPTERTDKLSGHSANDRTETTERPDKFDPNDRTETTELPDRTNSLTSENAGTRGVSRGVTDRGVSRGVFGRAIASDRAHPNDFDGDVDAHTLTYEPWGCMTPGCREDAYRELEGFCIDCYHARRPL